MPSIRDQLVQAIRQAEKAGLNRHKISLASGIPEATLSHIVNGNRIPRATTADRIAAALGKTFRIHPEVGREGNPGMIPLTIED